MQTQLKKTEFAEIVPQSYEAEGVEDPTVVRYGWTPFKEIYLYNADGTPNYFIQPVNSPFHRELPKNQLIAFETFNRTTFTPNHSADSTPGRPVALVSSTVTITAHQAATELLPGYASQGYTMLKSLQGLPQQDAFRIFQIVQPFDYLLYQLVGELEFAASERIKSTEPLVYDGDYTIQPLRNDGDRAIAERLRLEMFDAADRAFIFGTAIFEETEKQMIARFSGSKEGKSSADPRDRYLAAELNRNIPTITNNDNAYNKDLANKIDFLYDAKKTEVMEEKMTRLEAENAELRAAQLMPTIPSAPETRGTSFAVGDLVSADGASGVVVAKPFGNYKVRFEDASEKTFKAEQVTALDV
jgi:hypothetical protein